MTRDSGSTSRHSLTQALSRWLESKDCLRALLKVLTTAELGRKWEPRLLVEGWTTLTDDKLWELLSLSLGHTVRQELQEESFWRRGMHRLLSLPAQEATLDAMVFWQALTSGKHSLSASTRWALAADLLCHHYGASRHGWHTAWERPFEKSQGDSDLQDEGDLLLEWRARAFLESLGALRETLESHPLPGGPDLACEILLIDDQPHKGRIGELLTLLVTTFLNGFTPKIPNGEDFRALCYLARYTTLGGADENAASTCVSLLSPARFILVDQRLGDNAGPESNGSMVIRGISRFLADFAEQFQHRVPTVIALSREDDAVAVQSAVRSGAVDYLPKRRLLELPALLARVARAANPHPALARQNFRGFRNLPPRTVGLLRAAKIPRRDLHKGGFVRRDEKRCTVFHRLLEAIPKTDLHLHIGTSMAPEFLVVASFVGLLRHRWDVAQKLIPSAARYLRDAIDRKSLPKVELPGESQNHSGTIDMSQCQEPWDWVAQVARAVTEVLEAGESDHVTRSFAHSVLGIPTHRTQDAFRTLAGKAGTRLELAFLGPRLDILKKYGSDDVDLRRWLYERRSVDDLYRIYLLVLGARTWSLSKDEDSSDLLRLFRDGVPGDIVGSWDELHRLFYGSPDTGGALSYERFRQEAWRWPKEQDFQLRLAPLNGHEPEPGDSFRPLTFDGDPVRSTVATGLRSANLDQYLEGCEFCGALHLKHPALIHLYAQQAVCDLVRQGILYSELRGSPDGYVSRRFRFEFPDSCSCLLEAFSGAQSAVLAIVERRPTKSEIWPAEALSDRYARSRLDALLNADSPPLERRLPTKVSIVLVGKRHKSNRDMMLEAAAAAMLKPAAERLVLTAADFVRQEMGRCRIVGFDLAGSEEAFRPGLFESEFSRLSHLHIPITVHAGENASAQFIEEAIVDLGARRIGHGLTLVDDKALLARARDEGTCIELCPVSNHQTSRFSVLERPYPLRTYLDGGLVVTINTDNPVVSDTTLVKEFFQASYSTEVGLTLWDALRVIRFGFASAFLSYPERRAILELAEQRLIDLFSDDAVVKELADLADAPAAEGAAS